MVTSPARFRQCRRVQDRCTALPLAGADAVPVDVPVLSGSPTWPAAPAVVLVFAAQVKRSSRLTAVRLADA